MTYTQAGFDFGKLLRTITKVVSIAAAALAALNAAIGANQD
jgi:hypothetical protein